jgi:excinuclease ABC subunit C
VRRVEELINQLPDGAGVYKFFDILGRVLYIGKAKNLKRRVKSYFKRDLSPNSSLNLRVKKMVSKVKYLEYILVDSEADALILENTLIKSLNPKYNILLRDDKSYPYIAIDNSKDFPRFEITRKVVNSNSITYYGPFPSGARDILDSIYQLFPLVQKKGDIKRQKPCLFYQIKRCLAPCSGDITKEEYQRVVESAKRAIEDRTILVEMLERKMFELAENERFEDAIVIRDRIKRIKDVKISSYIESVEPLNFDIFTVLMGEKVGVAYKLFVRKGKFVSSSYSYFRDVKQIESLAEVYRQLILSHYRNFGIVNKLDAIIIPKGSLDNKTLELAIYKITNQEVKVISPINKDDRKRLLDLANKNARELLSIEDGSNSIEEELRELLNLSKTPTKIEAFDNSHTAGEAPVGGVVVWSMGKWDKGSFRKYKLKERDEYNQMRELLKRRVESYRDGEIPDLWVIDGGETLLNLAISILRDFNINLDVIAIAKERKKRGVKRAKSGANDTIFTQNGRILKLDLTDKRLIFIQKLRDKAHQFALKFHRELIRKQSLEIDHLLEKKVNREDLIKLLNYFGNFDKIKQASLEEITQITSKKVAKAIKD